MGIEIIRKPDGVLLTLQKFASDLLAEFNCDILKPFQSPSLAGIKLYFDDSPPINDPATYRRLVGKLNYLTHTRLDVFLPSTISKSIYGFPKTDSCGNSKAYP